MLVPLSTQIVADDPIEERQIAKEKYSSYKRPGVEPITIVKTYVKGNIRYWEECTSSGIIVRISSREILIVQEYNCTNWACMVLTGDYKL